MTITNYNVTSRNILQVQNTFVSNIQCRTLSFPATLLHNLDHGGRGLFKTNFKITLVTLRLILAQLQETNIYNFFLRLSGLIVLCPPLQPFLNQTGMITQKQESTVTHTIHYTQIHAFDLKLQNPLYSPKTLSSTSQST
jgi:hypothetical protein